MRLLSINEKGFSNAEGVKAMVARLPTGSSVGYCSLTSALMARYWSR